MPNRTYTTDVYEVDEIPDPVEPSGKGGISLLATVRPLDPGIYCIRQYQGKESAKSAATTLRKQVEEAQLAIRVEVGQLEDKRFGLFVEKQ